MTSLIATSVYYLLFLCLIGSPLEHVSSDALSYRLAPYEKSCFYQDADNATNAKIYFYFANKGQDQKVDAIVLDPLNQLLYSGSGETFGDKDFDIHVSGPYTFCFSNAMSFTSKIIDFDITVTKNEEWNKMVDGNTHSPQISAFEKALSRLRSELKTLQNYQRYFKIRDVRNAFTVEGTEKLVFWFSVFESLLIVGMAVLQVYILQNFFTASGKVRV